jgi:hypothetical protein
MDFGILCITKTESYSLPFIAEMQRIAKTLDSELVLAADGNLAHCRAELNFPDARVLRVKSKGFLESVHDQAVDFCQAAFILRLDDDELCSPAMVDWLFERRYRTHDHWKFPRAAMWTPTTFVRSSALWPDHQTRLSIKSKMQGRGSIHAGSPHGGGWCAPVAIEHHKFLVKSVAERRAIAETYDRILPGSGTGSFFKEFHLPEEVYGSELPLAPWNDGSVTYE